MWMRPNGIVTEELCPDCDYPYPVKVRHGYDDNGRVHDWDCPKCGGGMALVGWECPDCDKESEPTLTEEVRALLGEGPEEADLMAQEIENDSAWLDGWNEDLGESPMETRNHIDF